MANNFLKQLLNVVETGKLLGVTNIRDLYNTGFANSGISYKDFKKQMHDYKIYGNLGKNDMARLSGMYYGSKKADWEAKKPLDLARIEKRTFAPAFNLNTPDEISPLNIPVTKPVIKKTVVKSTPKPKNNSNSEQITEVTEIVTNPSFKSPQQDVQSLIEPNSSGNLEYDPITGRVRPGGFAGVGSNEHNALRNSKVGNWIAGIGNWIARNYPTLGGNSMIQFGPTLTADQVKEGWNNLRGLIFTRPGANPSFKTGGNLNKFQQGGKTSSQQDAVMQFVKALAQTLQADPQLVIQAALLNPEALKSAVQAYQESKGDIQKAAQAFSQAISSKTQAAKHGAKLNYLKSLKNKCAEDEELVYFKKGGKVGCGCVKKTQEGGNVPKKESSVMKFKKTIESKNLTAKDSIKLDPKTTKTLPNGKYPSNWTADDKITWEREHGPKDEGAHHAKSQKQGGEIKKDCGGSKMKLKKGDKVCPKCGKIHAAGAGCIAKFKMHKLGGSLNGIPFYLEGTYKSGIKTKDEIEAINNSNRNTAKGLFKGMISGQVLPSMLNIGRMISSAYKGYLDPETTSQTGIAPTPSLIKNPNNIIKSGKNIIKVSNSLRNKLLQRHPNDVKVLENAISKSEIPLGEKINFFKDRNGNYVKKYFDKKQLKWFDVVDDNPLDVQIVGTVERRIPRSRTSDVRIVRENPDVSIVLESPYTSSSISNYDYYNDDLLLLYGALEFSQPNYDDIGHFDWSGLF